MTRRAHDAGNPRNAEESSGLRDRRLPAAGLACAVLALVALAWLSHRVPYFAVDLSITRYVQSLRAGWFDLVLRPLNTLGYPPLVGIVYASTILLILVAGARWEGVSAGFATLGASGWSFLVKALVDRPRPPTELVHVEHHVASAGFPAGHVLNLTAFGGFLCYLACARLAPSWYRTALITLLVTMIALMGIARIHAGEHWPSDVLGGYLIGGVWLFTTIEFYRWGRRRARSRRLERMGG